MPLDPVSPTLRVLFVHQRFGAFGGAETNILLTAGHLQELGFETALAYGETTGKGESSCHRAFPVRWSFKIAGWETDVRGWRPDLVFVHNLEETAPLAAVLDWGLPVVRMVHDHQLYCLRGYKYNYFTRQPCTRPLSTACIFPCLACVVRNPRGALPLKWASLAQKRAELDLNKRCSHLLVYSEHSRGELTRNGFDARQISLFSPIQTDGPAFPESRFSERNLLLFTGQIIRGKGVDYLLRALARVKSRWECAILGEGNHRRACERLCRRLGLADRVRFYGYVAPDRSREFYEEATAMLVPSLWPEPFGMVGPEAMRCGIPVVAFDAGGIREWLRHEENGLLAPWGDIDCFARSIDRLLADKTLARSLGAHGRAWVREQYAADRQVRQLAGLFDRLAVRRGRVSEIFKSEVLCV